MKRVKLLFVMMFASLGAIAQGTNVDFNNPAYAKWGANAEERELNMFAATFMREALETKDYDAAAAHFKKLVANCPAASEAVYARAVQLYKAKIARATALAEKRMMIDSLMIVHDLRLQHFATHATRGTVYILDSKARDFFNYNKGDREGLREVFKEAIAGGATDPELVFLYFQNLCEDYKMDEVYADEVIAEYDRMAPHFENLPANKAELRNRFDTTFGTSGVASCENLETIFTAKMAAAPHDEKVLTQAVNLMKRQNCSTPFYMATVEKLYAVNPTPRAAMDLADSFQNKGELDKAVKYLRDALAATSDMEEQEELNARIALVEMAAHRYSSALSAARASLATADGTVADNGIALFVIANCYATSAASCEGFNRQTAYLAAYDAMQRALANFSAEEAARYKAPATEMAASFRQYFPTAEECFFNEVQVGSQHRINCGAATGTMTTIRTR